MLEFDNATELWSVVARFPGLDHLSIIDPKISRMLSHFTPGHQVGVGDIFPHLRPPNIHHLELSEIRFPDAHCRLVLFSKHARQFTLHTSGKPF